MTLAKAMKKKNRLAQKIAKLQQEIIRENSDRVDNPRKIDVKKLMIELEGAIQELITLKVKIFEASAPVRKDIFKLSELKSSIIFFSSINTQEGKVDNYGTDKVTEFSAIFDKIWVKEKVKAFENKIDEIQDRLDKFNHTTEINK
jgi:hypothetical protein